MAAGRRRRPAPAARRRSTRTGSRAAPARRAGPTSWSAYDASGSSAGRCAAQQPRHVAQAYAGSRRRGPVAAGQRELEVELAEPVAQRDVDEPQARRERAERRVLRRQQRRRRSPRPSTPTGHQWSCSRVRATSSARRSGASGSASSSTPCTRLPKAAPDGRSAIGLTRHLASSSLRLAGDRASASSSGLPGSSSRRLDLGLGA